VPLISRKVIRIVFIMFHFLSTLFEIFMSLRNTWLYHGFSPISLGEHYTNDTYILSELHTKFNVDSLFYKPFTRSFHKSERHKRLINATTSTEIVIGAI